MPKNIFQELTSLQNKWGSIKGKRLNLEFQAKQDKRIAGSLKTEISTLKEQEAIALKKLQRKFAELHAVEIKRIVLSHKKQRLPKRRMQK
jgi:hypothetical protein